MESQVVASEESVKQSLADAEVSQSDAAYRASLQEKAIRELVSEIAASQYDTVAQGSQDLVSVVSFLRKEVQVNQAGVVSDFRGDLSRRIASRSSNRATTSQRIESLLSIAGSSVTQSFSRQQAIRDGIRAASSVQRASIAVAQSQVLSAAVSVDVSQNAVNSMALASSSTAISTSISQQVSTSVSSETIRANAACTTAIIQRLQTLISQSGSNDGLSWFVEPVLISLI